MDKLNIIVGIIAGVLTILGFMTGAFRRAYVFIRSKLPGESSGRYPPKKSIVVVPVPGDGAIWWHMGGVAGTPAMQIVARFLVTNITDHDVILPVAKMKKPKLYGGVMVKHAHSKYHGRYVISPRSTTDLSIDFWLVPPIREKGEPFEAKIAVVDQFGNEHWIGKVQFPYR